eukprot:202272-Hanusia_phi.AAC.2
MVFIFYNILAGGWDGNKDETTTRIEASHQGLKAFLLDKWTLVDFLNYLLFIYYIILRISLTQMITAKENIIQVKQSLEVKERAASIIQSQLLGNFFNVLLCLLKCFKYYRFQPRLAIVNNTLEKSIPDLYHFALMFMTFLYGFSAISHVLFGPEMHMFSTLPIALSSGWMMMLGAGLDHFASMARVDGKMAVVFYTTFIFLVNIVLLNILLAILVRMSVKD